MTQQISKSVTIILFPHVLERMLCCWGSLQCKNDRRDMISHKMCQKCRNFVNVNVESLIFTLNFLHHHRMSHQILGYKENTLNVYVLCLDWLIEGIDSSSVAYFCIAKKVFFNFQGDFYHAPSNEYAWPACLIILQIKTGLLYFIAIASL